MIIWKGKGIFSVFVLIAVIAIFSIILPADYEDFAFVFGFLAAGFFSWYFGAKWNNEHGRVMIDKETGQEIDLRRYHSLFWIKLQYWGIIFSVIALVIIMKILT